MGKSKDRYIHVTQSRKRIESLKNGSSSEDDDNLSFLRRKKSWNWTHWTGLTALLSVIVAINVAMISTNVATNGTMFQFGETNYTFQAGAMYFPGIVALRRENMVKYHYNYSVDGVDKRRNLSLQEYIDIYDSKWPVIVTDVVPKWGAFHWSKAFFYKYYGQERVTTKAVTGNINQAESLALPLALFSKHVHEGAPTKWTYLEDELFIPNRPQLMNDIGENIYTEEDYFKLFPKEIHPWDAMLLWGSPNSRSPLHVDPYNWTGTNAVIKGKKKWKLYPPGQDHLMYVPRYKKSGFPLETYSYVSPVDAYDVNHKKYPLFKQTYPIEVEQNPGELLIIPSGWFHQAYNEEETIAISGQMMNSRNYWIILEELFYVGTNLARDCLPPDYESLSADEQVKTILSLLPRRLLNKGAEVNRKAQALREKPKPNKKKKSGKAA